jgi:hypothetical protein
MKMDVRRDPRVDLMAFTKFFEQIIALVPAGKFDNAGA